MQGFDSKYNARPARKAGRMRVRGLEFEVFVFRVALFPPVSPESGIRQLQQTLMNHAGSVDPCRIETYNPAVLQRTIIVSRNSIQRNDTNENYRNRLVPP